MFYSHVNYSVTKITAQMILKSSWFYSHVNYSVTKIISLISVAVLAFYSHVNYSVTKMDGGATKTFTGFTVT